MTDRPPTDDELRAMIEQAISDYRTMTGGEDVYVISKARWEVIEVGYQQQIAALERERDAAERVVEALRWKCSLLAGDCDERDVPEHLWPLMDASTQPDGSTT